MPIVRKPRRSASSETDVEALINRGGGLPGETPAAEALARTTPILLRLPGDLMERLDAALRGRPVKLPRHTWILEAIHEKLTRESAKK